MSRLTRRMSDLSTFDNLIDLKFVKTQIREMRKLKLETQISIDGYIADAEGKTNWMVWNWAEDWNWDDALRQYHIDLTTSSDCILLSRKMAEEGFHDHWEKVSENLKSPQFAFAKLIVDMYKVVFTKTLEQSRWQNTDLAKGEFVKKITQLKNQEGKDIIAYGGPTFASSLIRARLVDEFHLIINPTVLGSGVPFFKGLKGKFNLNLIAANSFDCGIVVLHSRN